MVGIYNNTLKIDGHTFIANGQCLDCGITYDDYLDNKWKNRKKEE